MRVQFGIAPVPMATLVKKPTGSWKAVIRKAGWPMTSKTFRTKRDAADWARRTEDEMVRGVYVQRVGSERTTVADALRRYVAEVVPAKSPTTQTVEIRRAKIIEKHLGSYSLAAVTPDVVAGYRDARSAAGRSNNTVRLELALLGHLYSTAIREWGLGLTYNPVANIRKPSPGNGRSRRLDGDEEQQLFEALDGHSNPMLGWIVRIALHTAMRKAEILSLRRNQVDLRRRVVRLERTKNGDSRLVPLSLEATAVFREALAHPEHEVVDSPLLFYGSPGKDKRRRPYIIDKVWRECVQKADLEDLRFHDLRHEAVSRLVEAGLTDQQVAAISGHKSMQMLKRYTHLRGEDLVGVLDHSFSQAARSDQDRNPPTGIDKPFRIRAIA